MLLSMIIQSTQPYNFKSCVLNLGLLFLFELLRWGKYLDIKKYFLKHQIADI